MYKYRRHAYESYVCYIRVELVEHSDRANFKNENLFFGCVFVEIHPVDQDFRLTDFWSANRLLNQKRVSLMPSIVERMVFDKTNIAREECKCAPL